MVAVFYYLNLSKPYVPAYMSVEWHFFIHNKLITFKPGVYFLLWTQTGFLASLHDSNLKFHWLIVEFKSAKRLTADKQLNLDYYDAL